MALDAQHTWVYFIRPTPIFVDASKKIGSYIGQTHNHEFPALGGVRREQILGRSKLEALPQLIERIKTLSFGAIPEMISEMSATEYASNTDYNPAPDNSVASDFVPQLAGFPEGHRA
ncbi:hypothetical protein HIM_04039 [Hirsutella minnesotensis 3608]|uniref:Uncharacterized protein n=1 Tax=Hirsutella minnesotensis 3608 TaxID=1043627 RepID=A0A0F7ZVJ1_9HYPO|nr:hypothetical protein HIM_04039 [Hirsutella minnesotensis 3608]